MLPRLRFLIVTPAPPGTRRGNRMTAERWSALLRESGHEVEIVEHYDGEPCDVMVALHASRSAAAAARFREERGPDAALVVALTGTDVYGENAFDEAARRSCDLATRIVVLQPLALDELTAEWRRKAKVVLQSARAPAQPRPPATDAFEVCVLAHLRPVKDPLAAAEAARLLPATSRLRVLHAGEVLDETMRAAVEAEAAANPRYRWLGELPHEAALHVLSGSRLCVVPSFSEGGANVVSEAIAAGVPVLSSRTAGSRGVLGDDWPAWFEAGDRAGLAALLQRAEAEPEFLERLRRRGAELLPLVAPARERETWDALVRELQGTAADVAANGSARLRLVGESRAEVSGEFAADVRRGLLAPQKRLSCRWLYDWHGSKLFEEICTLPEYYLTRTEEQILQQRAGEIAAPFATGVTLVELGSGSSAKTRVLLEELLRRHARLRYVPVDISKPMLEHSARALLAEYPNLEILAVAAEYRAGLELLRREVEGPQLMLWLGSNVGNFDRREAAAFLRELTRDASPQDRLLLGVDLRKDAATLERAYDDSRGVTARFIRNVLDRIDRELGGHFRDAAFAYRARYEDGPGRVVIELVSVRAQRVAVDGLDLEVEFAEGESIHVENSWKYSPAEIQALAVAAGLRIDRQWFDAEQRFSVNLLALRRPELDWLEWT